MGTDNGVFAFESANEAMRFGYNFSSGQYPMSIMARLAQSVGLGSGKGLVALDGAAIAGTVKRHVESLPPPMPAVLEATYTADDSRIAGIAVDLAPTFARCLGSGVINRRMVQLIICAHFKARTEHGKVVRYEYISDKTGASLGYIKNTAHKIRAAIKQAQSEAEVAADNVMRDSGLVA